MAGPEKTDAEIQARVGDRTSMDIFMDVARAAAQGATLGFSDELYGLYSEFFTGKDYDTAVQEIRQGLEEFRELNPTAAYGAEILGSMVTGTGGAMAGVGRTLGREAVKRAAGVGALEGAAYGAGTGETMEERAMQAAIGAPVGALTSAAGEAIMPRVAPAVRDLLRRGYPLSPGQRLGGALQRFEERLTSLPFTGEMVSRSLQKPMPFFRRDVVEDALGPSLAKKLPKGLDGNELVERASQIVSEAYDEVVPQLSINDAPFRDKAKRILGKATQRMTPKDVTAIQDIMRDLYLPSVKNGKISSNLLKDLESGLGTEARKMTGSSDPAIRRQGRVIKQMQDSLREEIASQNPDVPDLQAVNRAYSLMRPLEKTKDAAVGSAGQFTPTQLLTRMKDKPAEASMKATARLVQDPLTVRTGSPGTAERLLAAQSGSDIFSRIASDPARSAMSVVGALPMIAAYGLPVVSRQLGTGMYKAPGGLLRAAAPTIGEAAEPSAVAGLLGIPSAEAGVLPGAGEARIPEPGIRYETITDRLGNPVTYAITDGGASMTRVTP